MATFRQTLKHGLLHYPTIFTNPVDVLVHLFCVNGNGYEWIDGELVDTYTPIEEALAMKYPKRERDILMDMPEDAIRRSGLRLKDDAEIYQMKWVETHIEEILDARPTNVYMGREPHGHYLLKGISPEYADGLKFPDDIKKDWGDALYEFFNYWLYRLNGEYGVGTSKKDDHLSWWPKDILEARQAILDARARLHPLINNGETYEQHITKMRELMNRLLPPEIKLNN